MSAKLILYSCYRCSCVLFEERHVHAFRRRIDGDYLIVSIRQCNMKAIEYRNRHVHCRCGYFLGQPRENDLNFLEIDESSVKIVRYDVRFFVYCVFYIFDFHNFGSFL